MSKAILVLDEMPKSCMECEIFDNEQLLCLGGKVHFKDIDKVQSWCPLKELPKKLEFKTDRLTLKSNVDEIDNYIKSLGYERVGNIHDTIGGYNACIDEILGEENE